MRTKAPEYLIFPPGYFQAARNQVAKEMKWIVDYVKSLK